nr:hypothetical protein [Methylobacterium sp. ZNC0032]
MRFGADWTCDCGWANLDVRRRCRHCDKPNPTNPPINQPDGPGAYEGDVFFGDPVNTTRATHRWTIGAGWQSMEQRS